MNKIKKFQEYVEKGIVRKSKPNIIRSKDMVQSSERRFNFLKEVIKKIGINNENADEYIESSYNIIMELIRANLLIEGYKSSGIGAHEAEVSYMIQLGFSEIEAEFVDELRNSRNRMIYYGKQFNEDYAKKIIDFLYAIYPKLKKLVENN